MRRSLHRRIGAWAADRFGWRPVREHVLERRVAKSPWYFGDGATMLALLGVLVVTGLGMMLTYSPHPDAAYSSIRYITERQPMGWFVRGLHYWSAGLLMFMTVWHVLRQILIAGYKFPREGTWLVGTVMLVAIVTMAFTGYLLRWDERAIHAVRVALHILGGVPWIGEALVVLVQGDEQPGARLLTRLYAVHVVLLPLLLGVLVAWHLYLVVLHGVTSHGERKKLTHTAEQQKQRYEADAHDEEKGETFYPDTMAQSGAMAGIVLAIAVVLVVVRGPAALMPEANLTETSFPAEEWWWWWFSALVALLPPAVAPTFLVLFPLLVLIGMCLLPLVDRGPERGYRKRPLALGFVVLTVVLLVGLSGLRLRSPWTGWPVGEPPALPPGVTLAPEAETGRLLFARHGCTSCHSVAGAGGRTVAVDLAEMEAPRSRRYLDDYIRRPPPGVAMPAYEGWATEEEIQRLVDYVLVAQMFRTHR
jgi:ubiquinol-cytochrome c reductase cytochrome b subunit